MNPQQGVNLGTAYGSIEINTSQIDTALQSAQSSFDGVLSVIGQRMQNVGRTMSNVGQQITIATAPLTVLGGQGLRAAANFDDALREIQARAGLTDEAMQQVQDTALQLGADTVFSTQQAADAFLQLLTAGLDVEDALTTLPQVLNAAAAGNIDLGLAADLVTNVMSVFGVEAENTEGVIDAMVAAAASSPASMAQMGEALQRAGGQASMFGLDVEDTSAILAIFAKTGLRGSEAGTQLNSMLRNMSRNVPGVQAAWDELGVSLYDTDGNVRNLDTVFAELGTALENLPIEDQNRLIQTLAGSEGLLGFNALLASDGIDAMVTTMSEQASAAEIAKKQMESFRNQVNSLMGSVQAAMITAFLPFMNNVLVPLIKRAIEIANGIRAWTEANEALTQKIISVLAVISVLGPTLIFVGQAVALIGGAFTGLGVLLGVVLSPIGLMIGAVGLLGYLFRNELSSAISTALSYLSSFYNFISFFFHDLRNFGLQEAVLSIFGQGLTIEGQESTLEGLLFNLGFSRETAQNIVSEVFDALSTTLAHISEIFNRVSAAVLPAFREIATFVANNLDGIIDFAMNVFEVGRTLLALTNPLGQLGIVMRLFGVDLLAIFESVMGGVTRFFAALNDGQPIIEALRAAFNDSDFFNAIIDGFQRLASFITDTAIPALTSVWTTVQPYLQSLYDWFVNTGLPAIQSFITDTALPAVQSLIDTLIMVWEDVSPFLSFLADWFLTTVFPMVMDFITNTALPVIQSLIDILMSIWDTVSPALGSLYEWFIETGLPAIQEFIEGPVTDAINGFINILSGIWLAVSGGLTALRDNWEEIFQWIIDHVVQPVMDIVNDLLEIFDGVGQAAQDAMSAASDALGNPGRTVNQLGAIGNAVNSGQVSAGEVIGMFGREFWNAVAPGAATGVNLLPKDMLIQAHAGEAIIPAQFNPYNPDAPQANGLGKGIVFESVVIQANDAEGGRAAGEAFSDTVIMRLRNAGYNPS